VVRVTGGSNRRVSLAALIAVKPGCRPRLIYRVHHARRRRGGQRKGLTQTGYARLLDAAHRQLGGPLVVVWDNASTHVSDAMTALIAARDWLTVYRLPPYAHELNPVEPVWSHLKRSLAGLAKRNLAQLTALIKTRLRRMQYRPGLLDGFLASTGLDLTPFCNLRKSPRLGVFAKPGRRLLNLPGAANNAHRLRELRGTPPLGFSRTLLATWGMGVP